MAWRFRQSRKIGPFRITATTKGLAASFGGPGARVSVNTKGQVRRTIGIPGSGLYDTALVNPRGAGPRDEPSAPEQTSIPGPRAARRRWGFGTITLLTVMALVIVGQALALAAR